MTRVVITGAGGQLGSELVPLFTGSDVVGTTSQTLDVTDRDAVLALVCGVRPEVIVHAAAWTAVDACEADPERAFAVNALGTRHVTEAARRVGAHVVYVSTDYVFDGTKAEPYHEWDATGPLSVYGASKLAGEHELDPGATIVRTSWVFGRHGGNFVKTVLRLADQPGELRMVADQRGCPTWAADLAVVIQRLAVERRPGVFHVTNQVSTTWFDLARDILERAGSDPSRVVPITSNDLARPAIRPTNSVLDNVALRQSGISLAPDHREPLERFVKELTTT